VHASLSCRIERLVGDESLLQKLAGPVQRRRRAVYWRRLNVWNCLPGGCCDERYGPVATCSVLFTEDGETRPAMPGVVAGRRHVTLGATRLVLVCELSEWVLWVLVRAASLPEFISFTLSMPRRMWQISPSVAGLRGQRWRILAVQPACEVSRVDVEGWLAV